MSTVYGVTSGEYASYLVLGIFTTREKAETFAKTMEYSDIEEFLLDPAPNEKLLELALSGDKVFRVWMQYNGDVTEAPVNEDFPIDYGYETVRGGSGKLEACVRADSPSSAINIMNEYRIRFLQEIQKRYLLTDNHRWCTK